MRFKLVFHREKSWPQVKPGAATGSCACGFGSKTRARRKTSFVRLLQARAFAPKARSHGPITAPERFTGRFFTPSRSLCSTPYRTSAAHDRPLPALQRPHRISRAMRFAEVKEEAAGRGTRSKAHCPTDWANNVTSAGLCQLSLVTLNAPRPSHFARLERATYAGHAQGQTKLLNCHACQTQLKQQRGPP